MNDNFDLEFCFKGNRTYVHGTDIFNKIVEYLHVKGIEVLSFDLSFHGIAKNNITVSYEKPDNKTTLKFAFKYMDISSNKHILYGLENKKIIDCRYEYKEDMICKASTIDIAKQEVKLSKCTGYTFIENIVALNKYLLENLFPSANGKWYFTRLQLKEKINIDNNDSIKLVFKSNFNFKLTKTEIYIKDKSLGFIYFSLV